MRNSLRTGSNDLHMEISPMIYSGDFTAHTNMSDMASRIASDLNYEKKWKKIAAQKDKYNKDGAK